MSHKTYQYIKIEVTLAVEAKTEEQAKQIVADDVFIYVDNDFTYKAKVREVVLDGVSIQGENE